MQQVRVRQIFRVHLPINCPSDHEVSLSDQPTDFGFTLKDCNSERTHKYKLELFCLQNETQPSRTLNNWAIFAKRNPISFNTGEDDPTILGLKINHGIFDFRRQPEQLARIVLNYLVDGVLVRRGISPVIKVLPKKRHGGLELECTVAINWEDEVNNNDNFNNESSLETKDDHDRLSYDYDQQIVDSHISDSASPDIYHGPDHTEPQMQHLFFAGSVPESPLVQPLQNENYMVLYNGNAEVVGNFRALNFYKSSDINIKEDIRLLTEDHDCRDTLLQIDGVNYKFKKGVHPDTNRRFVGYIAQQVESVVPEAVQLIDGILHVDYESLIPYLSESVRANYNDIKNLKSESERVQKALDAMYDEFVKQEQRYKTGKSSPPPPYKSKDRPAKSSAVRFGLIVSAITVVLLAAIGAAIFLWPNDNAPQNPSTSTPVPPSPTAQPLIPLKPSVATRKSIQRLALEEFYRHTLGKYWIRNDNWMTDAPLSEWYGISMDQENVDAIVLPNNNLAGGLPDSFEDLNTIRRLDLHNNSIVGKMPRFDGWSSLVSLNLADNRFMDRIHSQLFRSALRLQYINLSNNYLSSTLPSTLATISLQYMDLSNNGIDGSIPSMTYLPLAHLDISNNNFDGILTNLPMEIRNLSISNNRFGGRVDQLKNLPNIRRLRIGNNFFTGELELLPEQLGQLEELYIANTQLKQVITNGTLSADAVCDASGVPFLCPLPDWLIEKCNAVCI